MTSTDVFFNILLIIQFKEFNYKIPTLLIFYFRPQNPNFNIVHKEKNT
jgi:hypothetical protein